MKNLGVTVGLIKKETSSNSGSGNAIGQISLTDSTSQVFTNQNEAVAYVQQFTSETLTKVSFDATTKTLFFDVTSGTPLNLAQGFCGKMTNAERLEFSDENGLIVSYESYAFEGNECNNIFGNDIYFKEFAFSGASKTNVFGNNNEFENNSFESYSGIAIFGNGNTFGDFFFKDANAAKLTVGNNNIISRGFHFSNDLTIKAGDENQFINTTFNNANVDFTCGKDNNFSNISFYQCTGVVKMNNNNIIGSNSFENFSGLITLEHKNNIRDNSFLNSTIQINCGNNNEFESACFYASKVFGKFGNDNAIGIYCFQQLENSFSATEKLIFGDRNIFNGSNFMESSKAFLEFGSENSFFESCFNSCVDLYVKFSTLSIFRSLCFNNSVRVNGKFDYSSEFNQSCFVNCSESNIFINKGFFDNNFAENSTSNFTIVGESDFRDDCFKNANPSIKNTFEWIKNTGIRFGLNYTGRFDIICKLGVSAIQNLPNDFFTTSNTVSIHYPNSLDYNNSGNKDGDIVRLLANITNANNKVTID